MDRDEDMVVTLAREQLRLSKIKKPRFTPVDIILIAYSSFWVLILSLTDSYTVFEVYAVLDSMLSKPQILYLLGSAGALLFIGCLLRISSIKCLALLLSTFMWLSIGSSVLLSTTPYNMRSSVLILAGASAYQFITCFKERG